MSTRSGSRRKSSSGGSLLDRLSMPKQRKAPTPRRPRPVSQSYPAPSTNQQHSKDLGVPSRAQYDAMEEQYILSLSTRKRPKALIGQSTFDDIWDVLHDPIRSRVRTPQFRFWVRKSFKLSWVSPNGVWSSTPESDEERTSVVMHDNRPVALKSQIYDIISYYHVVSGHGGRDRTMDAVRDNYSWIPKELVAQFVRQCPTCVLKKTGNIEMASSLCSGSSRNSLRSDSSGEMSLVDNEGDVVMSGYPTHNESHDAETSFNPCAASPSLFSSRILPSPRQPTGYTPNIGSFATDPYRWLSDLCHQPGPNNYMAPPQLPPLRRVASENDGDPIRRPRVTLPSLVKALSENHAEASTSLQRWSSINPPAANASLASTAPHRRSCDSIFELDMDKPDQSTPPSQSPVYTPISPSLDPALYSADSYFNNSYDAYPPLYDESKSSPLYPVNSFQGSLWPAEWSSSGGSAASPYSPPRSWAPSPEYLFGGMLSGSEEDVVRPSSSSDPQDWESSYVLEDVPCW